MKRGTIEHPKTLMLAGLLKVRHLEAVGILESLWHWTARYAPRGDIGKYANEQIARGIHWHGNSDRLVEALLSAKGDGTCGWLESDESCRFRVHDWHEHADQAVHIALKRKGLSFITGQQPFTRQPDHRMSQQGCNTVATKSQQGCNGVATLSRLPEPEPEPEPLTPPTPSRGTVCEVGSEPGFEGARRAYAGLMEQPELRGLTYEQYVTALKCHGDLEGMSDETVAEVRKAALLAGRVDRPGQFVERVMNRMELERISEKKDGAPERLQVFVPMKKRP